MSSLKYLNVQKNLPIALVAFPQNLEEPESLLQK